MAAMLFILASIIIAGASSFPTSVSPFWMYPGFNWTTGGCTGMNCPTYNTAMTPVTTGFTHPGVSWTGGYMPGFNCTGGMCTSFYHPGFNWTGGYFPGFNCTSGMCYFPGYTTPYYFPGYQGYYPGFNCTGGMCTGFFYPGWNCTMDGFCTGFYYPNFNWTGFSCPNGDCMFPGFKCFGGSCTWTSTFYGPVPAWYYSYFTGFNCTTGTCWFPGFTCTSGSCGFTGFNFNFTGVNYPLMNYPPAWYYNFFNYYNNVQFFPYSNVTFPNWYYRGEFQFLDFQMNQTTPFTNSLVSEIEVYTNVTFGYHPFGMNTTFGYPAPSSTEGYAQMFAGTYNGMKDNYINIDRTWSADTCGYNWTTGYINVWVRPLTGTNAGVFQEGYFTCFFNFTFPTTYTPKVGSTWSPVVKCTTGPINNYSYSLWYQFRFYNIVDDQCRYGKFITL